MIFFIFINNWGIFKNDATLIICVIMNYLFSSFLNIFMKRKNKWEGEGERKRERASSQASK